MDSLPEGGRLDPVLHQSAGAVVMFVDRCLVLQRSDGDEGVVAKGHLEGAQRVRSHDADRDLAQRASDLAESLEIAKSTDLKDEPEPVSGKGVLS